MQGTEQLELAYRYPFSSEAKDVVAQAKQSKVEYRYLEMAKERIESAVAYEEAKRRKPLYFEIAMENIKTSYVLGYVYARMLASAVADRSVLESFAAYEAHRSEEALRLEGMQNVARIAAEVGLRMQTNAGSEFLVKFDDFLKSAPEDPSNALVNQRLSMGYVVMDRSAVVVLVAEAMKHAIRAGLPIPKAELPKEVLEFAKGVHFASHTAYAPRSGGIAWIEKLLVNPIPDVRHRTVNLILAPYMTNIKNMGVDEATKAIMEYIERCKLVNPDTRISEKYVRYQCEYAKKKGMKPLKLENARELLGGIVDLGEPRKPAPGKNANGRG